MTSLNWILVPCLALTVVGCGGSSSSSNDGGGGGGDMAATGSTVKLSQTNLVSDQAGAAHQDSNLVNAWGLAFGSTGNLWVADNHSGVATVYDATGTSTGLVVTVPPPTGGMSPSAPTGQVFNSVTADFSGDLFIFSTEDGTISGWSTGTNATLRVDHSSGGSIYKGLAILSSGGAAHIFATDFHNGKVEVFDNTYAAVSLGTSAFVDPGVPSGFAPFGIQAVGNQLVVTYAKQDAMAEDDTKGVGNGYVSLFGFDGTLVKELVAKGALNSPWGVALAPASFGAASGKLLIGNFGDGAINAYDPTSGAFIAAVMGSSGAPLQIDGLWSLAFGHGGTGAAIDQLFFTAGPGDESHGLLGRLDLAP